jgi:hypothetical protein
MDNIVKENVLSFDEINDFLNISEVLTVKNIIDNKLSGSISFNVNLSTEMKNKIGSIFNLDLSHIDKIPMRWIKGDTIEHIDKGTTEFNKTHLIYLTNSEGSLYLENDEYPISEGNCYIFDEGINHKTINTGLNPRLLLGPMSEEGLSVG